MKPTLASILFLALAVVTAASAQPLLEPPPENLRVSNHPDSPLQITVNQMRVDPKFGQAISYGVLSTSSKRIIGYVIDGLPTGNQRAVTFEVPLLPGASRGMSVHIFPEKQLKGDHDLKIDFVLYQDGTTWGTRSSGDADYVVDFFEGVRRVITDSKRLVDGGDDAALTKFINSPPNFPQIPSDITKWNREQEGFMRGYGAGLFSFRDSVKVRGDLKGIGGKINDLENVLGKAQSSVGNSKRISMMPSNIEPPIKIISIVIGEDPVSFDQDMAAKPDWLSGLKVKVKNTSKKTIQRLAFQLWFPETASTGNPMVYDLVYGNLFLPGISVADPTEVPIPPNGIVEFGLDDREFEKLKKFIDSRVRLDDLSRVSISLGSIHYDDKTGWMGGPIMQDPEDPRRWMPVKP